MLAYLLAITTLIVSAGRLGDLTGRRQLLLRESSCSRWPQCCAVSHPRSAAHCRPGGAGPRRSHHDGSHQGLCRRDGSEDQDGSAMGLLGAMSAIGTALVRRSGGVLIAGPVGGRSSSSTCRWAS